MQSVKLFRCFVGGLLLSLLDQKQFNSRKKEEKMSDDCLLRKEAQQQPPWRLGEEPKLPSSPCWAKPLLVLIPCEKPVFSRCLSADHFGPLSLQILVRPSLSGSAQFLLFIFRTPIIRSIMISPPRRHPVSVYLSWEVIKRSDKRIFTTDHILREIIVKVVYVSLNFGHYY